MKRMILKSLLLQKMATITMMKSMPIKKKVKKLLLKMLKLLMHQLKIIKIKMNKINLLKLKMKIMKKP